MQAGLPSPGPRHLFCCKVPGRHQKPMRPLHVRPAAQLLPGAATSVPGIWSASPQSTSFSVEFERLVARQHPLVENTEIIRKDPTTAREIDGRSWGRTLFFGSGSIMFQLVAGSVQVLLPLPGRPGTNRHLCLGPLTQNVP